MSAGSGERGAGSGEPNVMDGSAATGAMTGLPEHQALFPGQRGRILLLRN
jgi:hypothetical protein